MRTQNANRSTGGETSTLEEGEEEKPLFTSTRTDRVFFFYASLAGTFGALSAVVGKLAVMEYSGKSLAAFTTATTSFFGLQGFGGGQLVHVMPMLLLGLRGLLLASNVFFMAQMWRWHLRALSCGPTPVCQIVNAGMNFAVSAFMGLVVFHEEVTVMWAVGALLVVIGLAVVVTDEVHHVPVQKSKSKER